MNIAVDKIVNYTVKNVKIDTAHLYLSDSKVIIHVPYQWIDDSGNIVRHSSHDVTEDGLTEVLGEMSPAVIATMKKLIPVGSGGSAVIVFGDNTISKIVKNGRVPISSGIFSSITLTSEQISEEISPMTIDQVLGMIQTMILSILA